MDAHAGPPPKISLARTQKWRILIVGILVAFVFLRVVPDVVRLGVPLGFFDYVTDSDGVVVETPHNPPNGTDELRLGDRVRIDRIPPFDRKPGIVRVGFTRENFDRHLPIERAGHERIVHLAATAEPPASRAVALLRILVFLASVTLGAILVIVKPNVATVAFFAFCLGGEYPTSFSDVLLDMPYRIIPQVLGTILRGAAPVGLLLFALCLVFSDPRVQRILAMLSGVVALVLGSLNAYAYWRVNYAALPAQALVNVAGIALTTLATFTSFAFVIAFFRAQGAERQRTGWIVFAFALAAGARLLSDRLFPETINYWQNSVLLSASVVPVIVVWVAVVKHHFFNIDFVVSRGLVYSAIVVAVVFTISSVEEIASYLFYNNTDLAVWICSGIAVVIGAGFGKTQEVLNAFADRFVFRERRAQRTQLERLSATILEATSEELVYDSLLHDVPSVLDLSFAGIMTRRDDGGFEIAMGYEWPAECLDRLEADHPVVRDVMKSRGVIDLDNTRSTMIKSAFPNERLTFVAPLFSDRSVSALVLYGHSVSGVDLDPDERTLLISVVAHASIALGAIELAEYRAAAAAVTLAAQTV